MNAKIAKAEMLAFLLYEKKYKCAVTEYGGSGTIGNADIFGFTKADFTHELEVKCSKADLAGEIASIKNLARHEDAAMLGERNMAKLSKHSTYLQAAPQGEMPWSQREWDMTHVPSRFSFVLPPELLDYALNNLIGTPYGVYVVHEREYLGQKRYSVSEERRPEQLHKNKVTDDIKEYLLHKTSNEIQILRSKDAKGTTCTACHCDIPNRCEKCTASFKKAAEYRACMKRNEKAGMDWMESSKICSV